MKYETKKKIKRFFKTKWKALLGGAIFLTIGLVVMLVGFSMSGWSIIEWLKSPWAITTFICLIIGLFLWILAFCLKKQADIMNG